jgi:exopolyphosphatase / guanosine-5'-triphosphate,3'-diphosphate pyrophosphatase
MSSSRIAVIDIGSNSIRLVCYGAPFRAPTVLFNEKVLAGLGKTLGAEGYLDPAIMAEALRALARFRLLATAMRVDAVHIVATAAVRQAPNGGNFLEKVRALGLDVILLSGEEEAEAAGLGVISSFEAADGIVGDLGGGSLELARVRGGAIIKRSSFPLGVLKIPDLRRESPKEFNAKVYGYLKSEGWIGAGAGLPLYLVGGTWRSLARLHMHQTHYPLPVLHHYEMPVEAAEVLFGLISRLEPAALKAQGIVASGRVPALADGAALLTTLVDQLLPSALIVSASGLREGLLYRTLPREARNLDPLILGARGEGERQGRFPEHGDVVHRWITPLFEGETAAMARLRHAACLLGDIGWAASPDFRAERGLETALHGQWLALDAQGRALLGQALWSAFGGGAQRPPVLQKLASADGLVQAHCWGLAIRLAQRLGGGVSGPLAQSRLSLKRGRLVLTLEHAIADLAGDAVERRLKQLATAMSLVPSLRMNAAQS